MQLAINAPVRITGLEEAGFFMAMDGNAHYEELMRQDGADLLLESASIEEVEHTYLGSEIIASGHGPLFEAITTQRVKLAQTMRAFIRVLGRGLTGTGILAGSDDSGQDTGGNNTIGGAIIGNVRRVAGIPVLAAMIPLSDGQSTSILFHSPTSDGRKVTNSDVLVAFQFLVNKRDVTHVVAPIGGRDVSLSQVAQALSNLIEKNSGKFKKQASMKERVRAEIDTMQNETEQLEAERSELVSQVNDQQVSLQQGTKTEADLTTRLRDQKMINTSLSDQLKKLQLSQGTMITPAALTDNLRNVKQSLNIDGQATLSDGSIISLQTQGNESAVVLKTPTDGVFKVVSKSMQGADMLSAAGELFKAYRSGKHEKYKVEAEVDSASIPTEPAGNDPDNDVADDFKYALVNRPAAPGAIPSGSSSIQPRPPENDPYFSVARHGIVTYPSRLTDSEVSQYELKYLPKNSEITGLAQQMVSESMGAYASEYTQMAQQDPDTFKNTVLMNFKKQFPAVAAPQNDDVISALVTDVKNALNDLHEAAGSDRNGSDNLSAGQPSLDEMPEADKAASTAINYLESITTFQSEDLEIINGEIVKVQEAAQAMVDAGVFDEHESLVSDAADHLIGMLATIQQGGV